jgi:hypothetical protein
MKTSIFNMNFTLPPMLEMTKVEKGMELSSNLVFSQLNQAAT